jgi:hypothetical protein
MLFPALFSCIGRGRDLPIKGVTFMYCCLNNCQGLFSFSLPFLPAAAEHKVVLRPPSQHIAMGLLTDSKGNGIAAQILNQRRLRTYVKVVIIVT